MRAPTGARMPLPVSANLSLPETIRLVRERTGEAGDRVCATLIKAALASEITATGCRHRSIINPARSERYYSLYFDHPALFDREIVPSSEWGASISWPRSRVGRYDLVFFERADVERWLDPAATDRQSGTVAEPESSGTEDIPSGMRPNRAAKAEEKCGQWISSLKERPESQDVAFGNAAAAVASVGPLSRKAFERQWAINARPEWKLAGRRRRS
jgi:hypothetical protein